MYGYIHINIEISIVFFVCLNEYINMNSGVYLYRIGSTRVIGGYTSSLRYIFNRRLYNTTVAKVGVLFNACLTVWTIM
ncbi:hypothetical protein J3Q64DRAFT_1717659 [Phycomyces blakesleeanus]|uniref:Uncharacterized protein n=1 Tax=Phycomyces blakesleeanus TaxID=4837 RepID=A0ABR3BHG7_PHYBL